MPKIPYKAEPCQEEDEDYEIVSFEDFCDKSPGAKADLLTLNDNINYRLCYESDKKSNISEDGETSSRNIGTHTETTLDGPKNATYKRKLSFAPFGRTEKTNRGPLFSGVIPRPRNEAESAREHRYERFSPRRGWLSRMWEQSVNLFPGIIAILILCALCVAAWWAVAGALAGGWGDDHYRRLWERVHPEDVKNLIISEKSAPTEYRYHDHNNLSIKNKSNGSDVTRKKDLYKKNSYTERPLELLKEACALVPDLRRFDCYPQDGATENGCLKRGCCWSKPSSPRAPNCFYPPQYETYQFVNSTENRHGMSVYYGRGRDAGYPGQFATARLDFYYLDDHILQIKITDADNKRFEPPYPEIPRVSGPITDMKYRVQLDSSSIGFQVIRNLDNVTIMNTQNVGGLILSDKFLQLSTLLPTQRVYGLGEKRARLLNDMDWNTLTLFNSDEPPAENRNLYGTHPLYLALEDNGNSHGVFLLNSNAMDVVLQPTPAVTFRAIGGVLDFFVLLGPSPGDVVAQYTQLVGRPFMPPYWSLGFHLCKFNYGSLNATRDVWQKNRDAGIPFDVQWNDLDYMSSANDFTYDKTKFAGFPEFVKKVHDSGMHYVLLFDPGVSASEKAGEYPPYDRGLQMNVFVKNSTNQPFVGKVWNSKTTVWPDFTHPNASLYWTEMMTDFHKLVPFDGAWIDMNEPSNFVSGSLDGPCEPESLPYTPRALYAEGLRHKTLCMDARHHAGRHYDVHNLYALAEAIDTHAALLEVRGKRPFVISRASFPGLGRVAGHWSGDVASTWHDMKMSIPELLSFSLFGVPTMGADICGFRDDTTPELCKRWMQLGAFYPFARNHNSDTSKPQDPVSLGAEVVRASRTALRLRYRLLPYYYSLFWRAHVAGATVAAPLFMEFPSEPQVWALDSQFLVGPHVMVAPVLEAGRNSSRAWFPGRDRWFSLASGRPLAAAEWKEVTDVDMVAVRGGAVLPLQEPPARGPVNTARTRSAPLQLLVTPGAPKHKPSGAYGAPTSHETHLYGTSVVQENSIYTEVSKDVENVNGAHVSGAPLHKADVTHGAPDSTSASDTLGAPTVVKAPTTTVTTEASGLLYWDDGDSINSYEEKKYSHIEFTMRDNVLTSSVKWWGYGVPTVDTITVLGQARAITTVTINGATTSFTYVPETQILTIPNLNLALDKEFKVKWNSDKV